MILHLHRPTLGFGVATKGGSIIAAHLCDTQAQAEALQDAITKQTGQPSEVVPVEVMIKPVQMAAREAQGPPLDAWLADRRSKRRRG